MTEVNTEILTVTMDYYFTSSEKLHNTAETLHT